MIGQETVQNFLLQNSDGTVFDAYAYQQQSWLLIVFYRGEWCGVCREQLVLLHDSLEWFRKRHVQVVAIGADDQLFTSILKNTLAIDFPVVSDESGEVFAQFHLSRPRDHKKIKPALFLIDSQHRLQYEYIGNDYLDRPSIAQLQAVIRRLQ